MSAACFGRMPISPSMPGATTASTSPWKSTRSAVTISSRMGMASYAPAAARSFERSTTSSIVPAM